ncbi:hypothetical protein [uncultured Paraglaciecola sp.]|uniref:hypothetical protein n=1 Tax=uncultured Paraglaciecola sp. TaxID=1765024 RepID=UPI002598CAC7|nr:hypothetical protein [uncultured Paraglaciecola sp.]
MPLYEGILSHVMSGLSFVEAKDDLDISDIKKILASPNITRIQTRGPLTTTTWRLINEALLPVRPNISIRIYNNFGEVCDFSFLEHLTNVRDFTANGLMEAKNYQAFSNLQKLERLKLSIYKLPDISFLDLINEGVTEIGLFKSSSKKPDLKVLERFKELVKLSIQGHRKNLEHIKKLVSLRNLSLSGLTIDDPRFLYDIQHLKSLSLDLINHESLDHMRELDNVESLAVSEIRNLENTDFLTGFKGLKSLHLDCLNRVEALPSLGCSESIEEITLRDLKLLKNVSFIQGCKKLKSFTYTGKNTIPVKDFEVVAKLPSLKEARIGTGSSKRNDQIQGIMENHSIQMA